MRCLLVDVVSGAELGTAIYAYETGQEGIILDAADHNLARQDPGDYIKGTEVSIKAAIAEAQKADKSFDPADIIGIGIDGTGSSPLPVDKDGTALGVLDEFRDNPNAHTWLWKDHTGHAEAAEITALAPPKSTRSILPSAAERIRPSGCSARYCIVCGSIRKFSMRRIAGLSAAIISRRF